MLMDEKTCVVPISLKVWPYNRGELTQILQLPGFIQASMSKIQGLLKDFSSPSNSFQGLKNNEKYWSKCSNSTSEMLDCDNGDISTGKLV